MTIYSLHIYPITFIEGRHVELLNDLYSTASAFLLNSTIILLSICLYLSFYIDKIYQMHETKNQLIFSTIASITTILCMTFPFPFMGLNISLIYALFHFYLLLLRRTDPSYMNNNIHDFLPLSFRRRWILCNPHRSDPLPYGFSFHTSKS